MPNEAPTTYEARTRTYNDVLQQFGADSTIVPESLRNSKVFVAITSCLTNIGVFDHAEHIVSIFRDNPEGKEAQEINATLELLQSRTGISRIQILADTLRHGTSAPNTSATIAVPAESADTLAIDSSSSQLKSTESSSSATTVRMLDDIF